MAIRESDRERTPEFSRSVIFTTSDIGAEADAECVVLFIVRFLICIIVATVPLLVKSESLRHKYILKQAFDTILLSYTYKFEPKPAI